VGERSYGKGTVQNVIPLGDGKRDLKLTTAYYMRPSNKKIHRRPDPTQPDGRESESAEWGVMPEKGYEVKLNDDELRAWMQWRYHRDMPPRNGKQADSGTTDKQLDKAVDYLKEQLKNKSDKLNAA
jgi:carboxyl-terminal processing protease